MHLVLLNAKMTSLPPTLKIAGALFLAQKILSCEYVTTETLMRDYVLNSEKELKEFAKELAMLVSREQTTKLTACKRKFGQKKFLGVSNIRVSVKRGTH